MDNRSSPHPPSGMTINNHQKIALLSNLSSGLYVPGVSSFRGMDQDRIHLHSPRTTAKLTASRSLHETKKFVFCTPYRVVGQGQTGHSASFRYSTSALGVAARDAIYQWPTWTIYVFPSHLSFILCYFFPSFLSSFCVIYRSMFPWNTRITSYHEKMEQRDRIFWISHFLANFYMNSVHPDP